MKFTSLEELLQSVLHLCPYEIAIRAGVLTSVELNFLVIRRLCSSGAPESTQGASFLLANYRKASFR